LEGEIWYNSTSGTLKVAPLVSGSWASGNNMINARGKAGGSLSQSSTVSAGLAMMGQDAPGAVSTVEEYDGATWTAGTAYPGTLRWHYAGGTQTAAFCATGVAAAAASPTPTATNEYNGTSWTGTGAVGTARYNGGSCGSQTAGLIFGGSPAPGYTTATETYDGSTWSPGGALSTARGYEGGGGTQTAALYMASAPLTCEDYNGTSWTAGGVTNNPVAQSVVAGILTAALSFGGSPKPLNKTESYDGSVWTNENQMGTARYAPAAGGGTATAAMGAGGYTLPPYTNSTEEWSGAATAAETITTS